MTEHERLLESLMHKTAELCYLTQQRKYVKREVKALRKQLADQ